MGHSHRHQFVGRELAQTAAMGFPFAKALAGIGHVGSRCPQQGGDGMPGVGAEFGGGRVVAGDDEDIRFQVKQDGQGRIYLLNDGGFGREVAIFTTAVGVFDVDEEE